MNATTRDELRRQLALRGFRADGTSPDGTMTLDERFLENVDLAELLDTMVARREKIFGSTGVVGQEISENSYHDVVQAVDAVKATIHRFIPP